MVSFGECRVVDGTWHDNGNEDEGTSWSLVHWVLENPWQYAHRFEYWGVQRCDMLHFCLLQGIAGRAWKASGVNGEGGCHQQW